MECRTRPVLGESFAGNKQERLRIMLATDSLEPSGVGEHMITLAHSLRPHAQVILVLADVLPALACADRAGRAGLAVELLPAAVLIEGRQGFAALLEQYQPDILHVHAGISWEGHGLVAAARESGRAGLAIVRTEHLPYVLREMKDPALDAAYAQGVQGADRIICVCEAACCTYRMSGIDARRFSVVRNGIAPAPASRRRDAVRAELGIARSKLILTVGRFTEQKRHSVLLETLPALLAAQPDVRLAWAGCGPAETALRARAAELGVAARILFLGRRNDVPDLMAAADVFCLPSTFEGHPLVVLEAMAAGLPVVATRAIGMTEAVSHGETGLLVPIDNVPALADALIRVLEDPGFAAALGTAGKAAFRQRFSAERMACETLAVYRSALSARDAGARGAYTRPQLFTSAEQVACIHQRVQRRFADVVPFSSRRKRQQRSCGLALPYRLQGAAEERRGSA